jgi:hypothetical protein
MKHSRSHQPGINRPIGYQQILIILAVAIHPTLTDGVFYVYFCKLKIKNYIISI